MSIEVNPAPEVEGLTVVISPHLLKNFENAQAQIREFYDKSPDVPSLVRLWLACATSRRVRQEFELGVLDIDRSSINPTGVGGFDDDEL